MEFEEFAKITNEITVEMAPKGTSLAEKLEGGLWLWTIELGGRRFSLPCDEERVLRSVPSSDVREQFASALRKKLDKIQNWN